MHLHNGCYSGVVTRLAGGGGTGVSSGFTDGSGSAATFYSPVGIAVDAMGTVYVAEYSNSLIRKISPTGAL